MSFLQNWLLWTLPLAALPVIIHLINQYRHRSVEWGAMQFLLNAKRMNRGMARLKQIAILTMRVLVLAGLIVAISRPLASGWFGVALGGSADTTIILLDRSASMEEADSRSADTKRDTALRKLQGLLQKTASGSKIVLIDSVGLRPEELSSPKVLLDLPNIGPTSTQADIPALLQRAFDYMTDNNAGRTNIWLISDLRVSDWDAGGARWESLRAAGAEFDGLRVNLLTYPEISESNLTVSLNSVTRRMGRDQGQLLLDVKISRGAADLRPTTVPIGFVVNGARTVLDVAMTESELNLQGHPIPIDAATKSGWGRVELPNDSNRQDNVAYFVFSDPAERKTVIVSDDERISNPMRVASSVASESGLEYGAIVLESDRAAEIDWANTAMVLWQAPLPARNSITSQQLVNFADSGRTVIFFPPERLGDASIFDIKWGDWQRTSEQEPEELTWWRPDSDLLQNTQNGDVLPVNAIEVMRYCTLNGQGNTVARLGENIPILTRVLRDRGSVYFCGVLPNQPHSNMAQEGICFYVMLQRALSRGSLGLAKAQIISAGNDALGAGDEEAWIRLAPEEIPPNADQELLAGAFQSGEKLRALNRPQSEDSPVVIQETQIGELLAGIDYQLIQDQTGGSDSLASEIWRAFIITMALAMVVEAILCLPAKKRDLMRSRSPLATG